MLAAIKKTVGLITLLAYLAFSIGAAPALAATGTQTVHLFFYTAQQWTPPSNVVGSFVIELWGGGAGGAYGSNTLLGWELSGATSSILYGSNTLVQAGGGFMADGGTPDEGHGGIAIGGDVNTNGNPGIDNTSGGSAPNGLYLAGGIGGKSEVQTSNQGFGGTWPGGGGGMGRYSGTAVGGGSGAYAKITLTLSAIGASTTIDVGGGGGGGGGDFSACTGSPGGYGGGGGVDGGTTCTSATFTQGGTGGGGTTGCGDPGTGVAGSVGGGMVGAGGNTAITAASPSGGGGGGGGTPRGDGGISGLGVSTCNSGGSGGGAGGANGANTQIQGGTYAYAMGGGGAGGVVEITFKLPSVVGVNQAKVIIRQAKTTLK